MEQKINLHNRFDIEVRDSRTGKLRQNAFAENIILNQAWAQILGTDSWFTRINFGTGTGTISATRTALFTPLSYKAAELPVFNSDVEDNWFSLRQSISILENEHVGASLSEVGVGNAVALCTHALLKDMNGNPVAIVKTSTDIITIYATVYLQPSTVSADGTGVAFMRSNTTNGLVSKLCGLILPGQFGAIVHEYWLALLRGPVAGYPQILANLDQTAYAYVKRGLSWTQDIANKRMTWYWRVPAADANATKGYQGYMLIGTGGDHSIQAPGIIGRLNSATLTQAAIAEQIGTGDGNTTDFATTFPFVRSGAVIKVDGVVTSSTVYTGLPNSKDILPFLKNRTDAERPDMNYFQNVISATPEIVENPYYATYGVTSIYGKQFAIESSDDMVTWAAAVSGEPDINQELAVPAGHQNKRYYRISRLTGYSTDTYVKRFYCSALDGFKNIRFASAPATGAVITAEYEADCAAKDVNHVLDIAVTIQLGEYTP